MEPELTIVDRSVADQHNSDELNTTVKALHRQTIIRAKNTLKNKSSIVKAKKKSPSFMQPSKLRIVGPVLFISLAMTSAILIVYFTSPKPNTICQLTFYRTMKSSLQSSPLPRAIAADDFNKDHHIDFVVANSRSDTIGVFISDGNGTFRDQQTYFTGFQSYPCSVVMSDLNNDTYSDIIVANYATNNIGILFGYGNGTFADQEIIPLGSSRPLFIAVADFNTDHYMDIVVVNNGTNTISILLGYGNRSFQHQIIYSTGYDSLPSSAAIGDFNNDTHLDIVVANYGTDNIGIFINYGNGSFINQQIYTTTPGSNPTSIDVGYINNDTQLDIVVALYGRGSVGLFFGQDNGSFLSQISYEVGSHSYPQYITISDINKDNYLDIIIIDSKNDQFYILPGHGNGNFGRIVTFDAPSGYTPLSMIVGDFNRNSQSDIIMVNYGTNNILALIDYFEKPSVRQTNYAGGESGFVSSVAVSDLNHDHIQDIVFNSGAYILILFGIGNGTFGRETIYSAGDASITQYVCTDDLNNDTHMDIIVADVGANGVDIFLGNGDGTFGPMALYSTGIDSGPFWVAVGDVNNDDILDIVSANTFSDNVGILLGYGNGTFAIVTIYSIGNVQTPYGIALGHLNHDDNLDLIVLNIDNNIGISLGYGNGSFLKIASLSTGTKRDAYFLSVADLNNDNHLDIVINHRLSNAVGVFLGYGNGSFTQQTTFSSNPGSQPYVVIVDDFNKDNISDIAATDFGGNQLLIFYGYGNGSFELARQYSTGFGSKPFGLAAADFNNDASLEFVVVLYGTGNIGLLTEYDAAEFVNKVTYSTDTALQPFSVTTGDFNHDNRIDIVVANSGTDDLSILFGSGNGTFSEEINYPIGTEYDPQYVITCDVNQDNYLDIVSVNSKNHSISVIIGYGNGSFAKQLIYSTGDGSYPYAITSGDLNNDNRLDLVVANKDTDSIGIFFGFHYRTFSNPNTYTTINNFRSKGIVVSDFNNDNILDIAVSFYENGSISILLGYDNGSFVIENTFSTGNGSEASGLAVEDFNNDGQMDIVVANYGNDNIGLFLGYGNGYFAPMIAYPTGEEFGPMDVSVADFDNDTRMDVVVANYDNDNIYVFLQYDNKTFLVVNTYATGQGSNPNAVTFGDLNNDGHMDIAVANRNNDTIGIFLGYGNGKFQNQLIFGTGYASRPRWVIVGDFNSDERLDMASANLNSNNVGILLGYGNGTFADVVLYSTGDGCQPAALTAGDFSDDHRLDIAVANYGIGNIVVLFGFGDGTFLLGTAYSTGIGSQPYSIASGDFNKDGQLDISVANALSSTTQVFLGYGSQLFAGVTTYNTGAGSQPRSLAAGDFNNDGQLDIVVANYGTNNISILLGHNHGVFDRIMQYSTGYGSAPYSVAIADFNHDTHLDIVVTNSETDNILIFLGLGNGSFISGMSYSTGIRSRPYTVTTSDFNNDNITDIAIANSGTSNIYLLYGYGNGTFGNDTSYYLGYGYNPYSLAAADLDKNGWIDIVIACYGTDHIEVFMKKC